MLTVRELQIEHGDAPLGLPTKRPKFSWRMESDRHGVFQKAYRLQIAVDSEFTDLTWDSGWTDSPESTMVSYAGDDLLSGVRYYVRVSVSDTENETSEWSAPVWFEPAPLERQWKAPFVGSPELDRPESSRPLYLRKSFEIAEKPQRCRIYATALGLYELYVNGERVGDAQFTPGWTDYNERLAYQVYDVDDLIRPGTNVIGVVLGPGWYKGDITWLDLRNMYGTTMALSLELVVTDSDGREEIAATTNEGWMASLGPIEYSELYHGETYDARNEMNGWATPDFDATGWRETTQVEFDSSRVVPQDGAYVKEQERIAPIAHFQTPRGEEVLDFGQNITGFVSFSVTGSPGDKVVLEHAEILDAEGNFYTENMRSARNRIEYVLSGNGEEYYKPHFTFQGFRYVRLVEFPGQIDPSRFEAIAVHSEMDQTLDFECSNDLLNQLHHNILWGWKGNSLDIPTDCPQRDERLGWTGDAQVFVGTASYLMNVGPFFRKWLRDLAAEQLDNGGVPFVIPDVLTAVAHKVDIFDEPHSSTGWGDAAVVCPWTMYNRYGDRELLREHYPMMKGWIDYIRNHAQDGLIWNSGFHFGDWVALDAKEGSFFGATPNDLTATAYYAFSTSILAEAAKHLGEAEDERRYRELHKRIVEAFQEEFITPKGRLAAQTQTAHILALVFDLVPEEFKQRTVDTLVRLIRENGDHLTTGFLGTPFLCKSLADNGRLDVAYELLMREEYPSWLYQVKQGATTIWEHWDGIKPDGSMWSPEMNSFNHYAYGAIGEWMYATVGGIDLSPGQHSEVPFRVAPRPGGGITWSRTSYKAPQGELSVYWELQKGSLQLRVSVPPNSKALIEVGDLKRVVDSGTHEVSVPYTA